MSNYETTLKNFEAYLASAGYNTVAKTLDGSATQGFLCELLTKRASFFMKIRLDETLGFALVDVYPGITIPAPYLPRAAQYAMEQNAPKKAGALRLCPIRGDLFCHVEAMFFSSPLTGADLEIMESIAVEFLLSCLEDLLCISQGHLPD